MMRFTLILLLLLFTPSARARGETILLQGTAQGTTYHIKFVAPKNGFDAQPLQADIERLLADIDRQMSTYRSDSELSRFNRAPAGEWFAVSPAVVEVVNAARMISEKTDGAMDVTVGPIVQLWHFGSKAVKPPQQKKKFEPPSDEQLQEARERVGYSKLETRDQPPALKKEVDGLEGDLSSIASGYTIDHVAKLLIDQGMKDFMVELGGEVRARGKREDGMPWRIAIERPTAEKREMAVAVPLIDGAMATAGGTHRFFEFGGRRYSHIIDPATGRPVEHSLASVTVVADTCIEADGWDTPLLVLGPKRGTEVAEKNNIAAMFISHADNDDASDAVTTTSAWRKRFGDTAK